MVFSGSSQADAARDPLSLGDPAAFRVLRLWRTRIVVAREDEYQRFANERSLPMFRSQPGFLGLYFAGAGDERVVATLWDSASAADALDESPTYLSTVAAIQEAGFLRPPQSVEVLEIHTALVSGIPDPGAPR